MSPTTNEKSMPRSIAWTRWYSLMPYEQTEADKVRRQLHPELARDIYVEWSEWAVCLPSLVEGQLQAMDPFNFVGKIIRRIGARCIATTNRTAGTAIMCFVSARAQHLAGITRKAAISHRTLPPTRRPPPSTTRRKPGTYGYVSSTVKGAGNGHPWIQHIMNGLWHRCDEIPMPSGRSAGAD
jgi:hypothetical protein